MRCHVALVVRLGACRQYARVRKEVQRNSRRTYLVRLPSANRMERAARIGVVTYSTGGLFTGGRGPSVLALGLTPEAATGQSLESVPASSMGQPGVRAVSPEKSGAIPVSAIDPVHAATRPLDEVMHRYARGDDG